MTVCHTPDRNFCCPGGKHAALMVDIDGTMLVCQPYFDEAAEDFAYFMELRGFDRQAALDCLEASKRQSNEKGGFERDVFPRHLVSCYQQLLGEKKRRITRAQQAADERILHRIGAGPYFREPQVFPNVLPVLTRAQHHFMMIAVSIGNREAQKYKFRQSGLDSIFDHLIVTSLDNKAAIVREIIHDLNVDPTHSAFIGNSQRSDGACLEVTNFVYLPLEPGWAFDLSRELPQNTGYEMFNCKDWREAEERAIVRLVRRRSAATGEPEVPDSRLEHRCSRRRSS